MERTCFYKNARDNEQNKFEFDYEPESVQNTVDLSIDKQQYKSVVLSILRKSFFFMLLLATYLAGKPQTIEINSDVPSSTNFPEFDTVPGYKNYNYHGFESYFTFVLELDSIQTEGSTSDLLTVYFIKGKNNSIDGCKWDFGDGQTSIEQYPKHTYANDGAYTATLTVYTNDSVSSYSSEIKLENH
jgi:hypothetical protein